MLDQYDFILRHFDEKEGKVPPLYILVHSMDMGQLRSEEAVNMLATLAKTERIRMVVSLDHIKAGMLFSDTVLDQMNMACLQVDTY